MLVLEPSVSQLCSSLSAIPSSLGPIWFIPAIDLLVLVSSATLLSHLASNSLDFNRHLKYPLNFTNHLYSKSSLYSSSPNQVLHSGLSSHQFFISPVTLICLQSPINILFTSALSFSVQSHRGPYLNLTEVPEIHWGILNKTSPLRDPPSGSI